MATTLTTIEAKFVADTASFNKALEQVSATTQRTLADANSKISAIAENTGKSFDRQAKKIGSALGNLSGVIGQYGGEFAQFGQRAIGIFGSVKEAITSPGGISPALIGIGGTLALLLPKISEFGEAFQAAIKKAADSVRTVFLPELDNALKAMEQKFARTPQGFANPTEQTAFNKIVNDYAAALNRAGLESQLTGDKTAELQARLNAAKTAFLDIKTQVDTTNLNGYSEEFQKLLSILEDFKKTQREIQLLNATAGPPADLAPQQKKQAKPTNFADTVIPPDTKQLLQTRFSEIAALLETSNAQFNALIVSGTETALNAYNQFAQGVGDAVANSLVYQQDFGKAIDNVLKSIAASIISSLVQIGIQQLLLAATAAIASKAVANAAGARAGAEVGADAAIMFASVAAGQTVATFGLGFKAALATAATASALLVAGALAAGVAGAAAGKGVTKLATGGIVTSPTMALVGEAGSEAVIPLDRVGDIFGNQSGGYTIQVQLDGRTIMESAGPHLPKILRLRGVKG